jgi:hypothetical protein
MRSLGKGVCQPQCESVKVLSPEIFLIALGQGFHCLEASIGMCVNGECISDVPGSKSVAGNQTVYIGTWENRSVPYGSGRGAENVTRPYGVSVVGLTHSRGVGRVMPVESHVVETLEGVSSLTQRDEVCYAIH